MKKESSSYEEDTAIIPLLPLTAADMLPRLPFPPKDGCSTPIHGMMFSHAGENWAMPSGTFAGINWLLHDKSLTALERRGNVERAVDEDDL